MKICEFCQKEIKCLDESKNSMARVRYHVGCRMEVDRARRAKYRRKMRELKNKSTIILNEEYEREDDLYHARCLRRTWDVIDNIIIRLKDKPSKQKQFIEGLVKTLKEL